jgi:P27 family predicted phage terminase small subunit
MARVPKPTAIKLIEGNPGRRPLNKNEPKFPIAAIEPPDFLDDIAKGEWHRLAEPLRCQNLLTIFDTHCFAAYCAAYSRWVRAEKLLEQAANLDSKTQGLLVKGERGRWVQNPLIRTANTSMDLMLKTGAQFGVGPAARSQLSLPFGEEEDNPYLEFVRDQPVMRYEEDQ